MRPGFTTGEKTKKGRGDRCSPPQGSGLITDVKPLKDKVRGAVQLSDDHDGETYRAVYTVELEDAVYVLHCFQKKSKSGIATPQAGSPEC